MNTPLPSHEFGRMPQPSAEALAHSRELKAFIEQEVKLAGGWISFARYMDLALYAPGLGYYSAGAHKFGQAGDFVTAPEISDLFGQCLARQIAEITAECGGDVLELGPGSGKLAFDVLQTLDEMGAVPQRYLLLEVSADLRMRQQIKLATLPAHLASKVQWLDALPGSFTGTVIANEVLDVLPVHLLRFMGGGYAERGVVVNNEVETDENPPLEIARQVGACFAWRDRVIESGPLLPIAQRISASWLGGDPPDGYTTEACLAAPAWIKSLAAMLERGAMIFIDYGFKASEYYHPSRVQGTLMCHYRHFAHGDPFYLPGLQDITSHVDFTAVAEAVAGTDAEVLGYTTQSSFLIGCGIAGLLQRVDPADAGAYLPLANQAQRLMSPAEMGEFFKVLAIGKGIGVPLCGFVAGRPLSL